MQTTAPVCSCCNQPMKILALEGHYSHRVEIDLCANCHLVWFDAFESVRLSGLGWVQLLRQMLAAPPAGAALSKPMRCVRCSGALAGVRNLTRFGRTAALECVKEHGQYQSFSLLLAERGLVRPLTSRDRNTLVQEGRELCCLNCGAAVVGEQASAAPSTQETECAYCQSPLVVVDLQRLSQALLVRHGDVIEVDEAAEHLSWACTGCGQSLDPTQDTRCPHCDHSVALPNLAAVKPLLDRIEPLLQGKAPRQAKPWGHKLAAQRGDSRATQLYRWVVHHTDGSTPGSFDWHEPSHWVTLLLVGLLLYWLW